MKYARNDIDHVKPMSFSIADDIRRTDVEMVNMKVVNICNPSTTL